MSKLFKPSEYTDYQKTTQWLNTTLGIHDMYCFCDKPWIHMLESILERNNFFEIPEKDKRLIQKCLVSITTKDKGDNNHTEDASGTHTKEDDGFDIDIGDLEKLFEEDDKNG